LVFCVLFGVLCFGVLCFVWCFVFCWCFLNSLDVEMV